MQNVLEGLNDKQIEAVKNIKGANLIIAGAGSGKTKVLTHKIAYLIQENDIKPWNILAITFTNKAANEMKNRIGKMIGEISKDMWIRNFSFYLCKNIKKKYRKIRFCI